jgi:hypothetical protein
MEFNNPVWNGDSSALYCSGTVSSALGMILYHAGMFLEKYYDTQILTNSVDEA